MSTCNRFDLGTLGHWLTMPKNLLERWLWQVLITLRLLDEQSVIKRKMKDIKRPNYICSKGKDISDSFWYESSWLNVGPYPYFVATRHGAQGDDFLRECKTFNIHHQWPLPRTSTLARPYVGFAQCTCYFSKLGPIPKSASLNLVVPVNSNCLTNKNVLFTSFCEVSSLLYTIHHWMAESH